MIEAKIIADSISSVNIRITTFVLTYPRYIHSELLTHRMLSRNASSSRAIPVKKQIEMVKINPAIPLEFRKNKKGMQSGELLENQEAARNLWLQGRDEAVKIAENMEAMGISKEHSNRILEPYAHITVVCTATSYDNFFALRCHKDAQPEIRILAKEMYKAMQNNSPVVLTDGEWHIPFIPAMLQGTMDKDILLKRSVAKCARVSYLNHDGSHTTEEQDLQLYNRLVGSAPIHASPAEHQAMATSDANLRSGNFCGWVQYRQTIPNQNIAVFITGDK